MRKTILAAAAATGLSLGAACLCLAQTTVAAGEHAAYAIDRETESCLRRIFSKRISRLVHTSAEQQEKLDKIMNATTDTTRPIREQLRHGVADLSHLFASDQSSDDEITQRAHELRALHEKIMDERLAALLKARHILTKEQRQKIDDRINEFISSGAPRRLS